MPPEPSSQFRAMETVTILLSRPEMGSPQDHCVRIPYLEVQRSYSSIQLSTCNRVASLSVDLDKICNMVCTDSPKLN